MGVFDCLTLETIKNVKLQMLILFGIIQIQLHIAHFYIMMKSNKTAELPT